MTQLPKQLIQAIRSGRAILFTGAGFSTGCKNFNEESPLCSKKLANSIGDLGGFDASEDLKYAVEYFLSRQGNKVDLINLLKDIYTLKETAIEHQNIVNLPWMRCYTTNYDNSIELAGQAIGKRYISIDVTDNPKKFSRKNLVVHINGTIEKLAIDNLDSSFKLSRSSYLTDEGFKESPWYRTFKEDIDRCSAIIFVGYSLYDFEVEKLLNRQENLNAYFITKKNLSDREKFNYEKYGSIFTIETKGFAQEICNLNFQCPEMTLCAFKEVENSIKTDLEPTDRDIEKLFVYGTLLEEIASSSTIGQYQNKYIINRTLEKDLKLKDCHHIIVGALGTGKTIFLTQLGFSLAKKGFHVYNLIDPNADFRTDIDVLAGREGVSILLIDDYSNYPEILYYIGENHLPEKIYTIATSRPSIHSQLRSSLEERNFNYDNYSIDLLSSDDASKIVAITNSIGGWGELAAQSNEVKRNKILYDTPDFATFLLKFFESDAIQNRIKFDMKALVSNPEIKETIFAICFLTLAGVKASYSMISEIAQTDIIRSSKIKKESCFTDFFKTKNYDQIVLSSIFAQYFLKTQFSASEIQSRFLDIADTFNKKRHNTLEDESVFKHVLKFSSLDNSLPDTQKKNTFNSYYDSVKRRVTWLETAPHFWLQYGMAKIALKEYDNAQKYLDIAYRLAKKPTYTDYYYDVSSLDTQQARLWIQKYIDSDDGNEKFDLFKQADKKLRPLSDDKYKYRQLALYPKVISSKFASLSKENQNHLEQICSFIEKRTKYSANLITDEMFMDDVRCKIVEAIKLAKRTLPGV